MEIVIAVAILGGAALILGFLLSFASKVFAVEQNEKEIAIREALPGANCGGCGYAGCDQYAEAVANGEAEPNLCAPGGKDAAQKIGEILGVTVTAVDKRAIVLCQGDAEKAVQKYEHNGKKSCAAAKNVQGGPKGCAYGCIGFGDCVKVCENNAIQIINGIAFIDTEKCTGCGKCAKVCPNGIISIMEYPFKTVVKCKSLEKGAVARKVCTAACIGCGICTKKCEKGAITVENNLAVIDSTKCTLCGACIAACPQKAIK